MKREDKSGGEGKREKGREERRDEQMSGERRKMGCRRPKPPNPNLNLTQNLTLTQPRA